MDHASPVLAVKPNPRLWKLPGKLGTYLRLVLVIVICLLILARSNLSPANQTELIRSYTRSVEFDYVSWEINALFSKLSQVALGLNRYVSKDSEHKLVVQYLDLIRSQTQTEDRIAEIYANPDITDPEIQTDALRNQLNFINNRLQEIGPAAETFLQGQVSDVASSLGLGLGGQPTPPVWYHITPLPLALIISPRNVILSESDISLVPNLPIDQIIALEDRVSKGLDLSALVVPVGGIGVYPTMVMSTDDLSWLAETVAHEWTHNFLTLHPLGLNYDSTPELRTMNETTANIVGKEIGTLVLQRYYPELVPPAAPSMPAAPAPSSPEKPVFNFQAEMHTTRVVVDQMLKEGKITEAESYMEARRRVFYENGYRIRKLNQAYFAFYGAYADVPGGAAGADPVGPAVRALRQQSPSLASFLNRIAWMSSFKQLQDALKP